MRSLAVGYALVFVYNLALPVRGGIILETVVDVTDYGDDVMLPELKEPSCMSGKTDLVFVVDSSSGTTMEGQNVLSDWLAQLVEEFEVTAKNESDPKTLVSIVQYSDEPNTVIPLGEYESRSDLLMAIGIMDSDLEEGSSNTGKAINYTHIEVFGKYGRSDSKKIAVLITDEESEDDVESPSKRMKDAGIIVFTIGIGDVARDELEEIASQPAKKYVYTTESFDSLQKIKKKVRWGICRETTKSSKQKGRKVTKCLCQNGKAGTPGPRGLEGPRGQKGEPGQVGSQGPPGPPGQTGSPGKPAPQNTTESDLISTLFSPQTMQELQDIILKGSSADAGAAGPQGPTGQKGNPGLNGPRGPTGAPGQQGAKGDRGAIMSEDDIVSIVRRVCGEMLRNHQPQLATAGTAIEATPRNNPVCRNACKRGPPGPQGERGYPGSRGRRGYEGPQGLRGHPGREGIRGSKGEKGDQGDRGQRGPSGIGRQGPQGHPGRRGTPGISASALESAAQPGPRGSKGQKGETGVCNPDACRQSRSKRSTSDSSFRWWPWK